MYRLWCLSSFCDIGCSRAHQLYMYVFVPPGTPSGSSSESWLSWLSFSEIELHNIGGFTMNLTDPTGVGDSSFMGVENPSVIGATLPLDLMISGIDAEVATS